MYINQSISHTKAKLSRPQCLKELKVPVIPVLDVVIAEMKMNIVNVRPHK